MYNTTFEVVHTTSAYTFWDRVAAGTNPKIVFVVWAKCGHCHALRRKFADNLVRQSPDDFMFLEYTDMHGTDVCKSLGIAAFPTVLLCKPRVRGDGAVDIECSEVDLQANSSEADMRKRLRAA